MLVRHPVFCDKYIKCVKDDNIIIYDCQSGFSFNEKRQICENAKEEYENCIDSTSFDIDSRILMENNSSKK